MKIHREQAATVVSVGQRIRGILGLPLCSVTASVKVAGGGRLVLGDKCCAS
jgi:hypothetical protein